MIDLSWLEKLGLELLLMMAIAIGCFIWGDTHRGTADANVDAAKLIVAQNKQNMIDKNTAAKVQADYDSLSADQDGDIKYGIDQHNLLVAERAKNKLAADCVLSDGRMSAYRSASPAK